MDMDFDLHLHISNFTLYPLTTEEVTAKAPRLLPPAERTPQKSPAGGFLVPDSGSKRRTRLFSGIELDVR